MKFSHGSIVKVHYQHHRLNSESFFLQNEETKSPKKENNFFPEGQNRIEAEPRLNLRLPSCHLSASHTLDIMVALSHQCPRQACEHRLWGLGWRRGEGWSLWATADRTGAVQNGTTGQWQAVSVGQRSPTGQWLHGLGLGSRAEEELLQIRTQLISPSSGPAGFGRHVWVQSGVVVSV